MFYTAIIMGLAGSLHCAGMCSPLAMAVTRNKPFLISSILYNSGRIFIYALLGALAAAMGAFIHLSSYQQLISILLGCIFILAGFSFQNMRVLFIDKAIVSFTSKLKKAFGVVISQKSGATTFLLGMINGMLPCGLTYLALSACLILPSASEGFLFMISFGLGTWPVMIGTIKLIGLAQTGLNFSLARLSKVALVFIGCTLLVRVWWVHPHTANLLVKTPQEAGVWK
jgi:sulfite exporter TauE/SafE